MGSRGKVRVSQKTRTSFGRFAPSLAGWRCGYLGDFLNELRRFRSALFFTGGFPFVVYSSLHAFGIG